eukprot:GILI01010095.1.p1 GENE.GILI01010095.1~~GILI01010095.1.p1  ORF type:complete len:156 (+),score=15.47 GILI01010095.1:96-563(+)
MSRASRRLQREIMEIQNAIASGTSEIQALELGEENSNMLRWTITVAGANDTLYAGEVFKLRFTFSDQYPIEAPEVIFLHPVPVHPHIYSNGHICLSILYDAWSPALTVHSCVLSLLSMLSSCTEKIPPDGDAAYVSRAIGRSPKDTRWVFHDDGV